MALANNLKRRAKPWTPWQAPASPPPGTYDPSLDAALRAAERGYGDLRQDTERDQTRASSDFQNALSDVRGQTDMSLADLLREQARAQQDAATSRQRLGEDFSRATGQLNLRYQQLGGRQGEQQRQMGVSGGGAVAQSLAKRLKNRANEQFDLTQTRDRQLADIATQEQRFGEDVGTQRQRLQDASALQQGRLGQQYERTGADLATTLGRSARELGFFGQDTSAQRFFQATQSGQYAMPGRGEPGGPASNEFVGPQGPYKVILRGGRKVRIGPNGRPL